MPSRRGCAWTASPDPDDERHDSSFSSAAVPYTYMHTADLVLSSDSRRFVYVAFDCGDIANQDHLATCSKIDGPGLFS